jgi:hypothetical protein
MGATGLEPVTPSVSSNSPPDASVADEALREIPSPVCTPVCTRIARTAGEDNLEKLAAALLHLSPAERARLAAILVSGETGSEST